jgi:protein-S-isoprenylcysteine O-methyltransferase Ste14
MESQTHNIINANKVVFTVLWIIGALGVAFTLIALATEISWRTGVLTLSVASYLLTIAALTQRRLDKQENEKTLSDETKEFRDRNC